MAWKHGPSLCLQAHFDSSSACGHYLIQPLLRCLFSSNDAKLRCNLAISSSFPSSFFQGESRAVCQAYLHVLFQMNASPFNTVTDRLDCCVIHELSTALTYTTDNQLFFNQSDFARHKTVYQGTKAIALIFRFWVKSMYACLRWYYWHWEKLASGWKTRIPQKNYE